MSFGYMTEEKANTVGKGVLLIGLGILFFINNWWPGILLVILASIGTRHFLLGKYFELAVLVALFFLILAVSYYRIEVMYLVPSLLIITGLYFILKEYFNKSEPPVNYLPPSSRGKDFDQGNGNA